MPDIPPHLFSLYQYIPSDLSIDSRIERDVQRLVPRELRKETPESKIERVLMQHYRSLPDPYITAALEKVEWSGQFFDPIRVRGRLFNNNVALLKMVSAFEKERFEIETKWVIYDFDHKMKSHFPVFFSNGTIKLDIDPKHIETSDNPCSDIEVPTNFEFGLSLWGKGYPQFFFYDSKVSEFSDISDLVEFESEYYVKRQIGGTSWLKC